MRYQSQISSYKNSYNYSYKSVAEIVEEVFTAHDKAANREQSRLLVLYLAKMMTTKENGEAGCSVGDYK